MAIMTNGTLWALGLGDSGDGTNRNTPTQVTNIFTKDFDITVEPTYTVTYDLNGGTVGTAPTEGPKTAGAVFDAAQLPGDVEPPEGKYFVGWNTAQSGNGQAYGAGATITMPSNAITLYAIWEYYTYSVTLTEGTGYTLTSLSPSLTVTYGGSFTFGFTLDPAYSDSQFTILANGNELTAVDDGVYTVDDITENTAVTVTGVELNEYSVTLTQGTGYSLTAVNSSSPVYYGDSFTFMFILEPAYSDSSFTVYVNGVDITLTNGEYIMYEIIENKVVTVSELDMNEYSVTLTPGRGYTLTALNQSSTPVAYGGAFTFGITLSDRCSDSSFTVYVNGVEITAAEDGIYTIDEITENKVVTVTGVTRNIYDVILYPGTGYTLTAVRSPSPVIYGHSFTFAFSLDDDYSDSPFIIYVNDEPISITDGGTYRIRNITELKEVTVSELVMNEYSVTLTPGIGYSLISLSPSMTVTYGGSFTFAFSLDDDYTDSQFIVYVNGAEITAGDDGIYTIEDITEDQTVTVTGVIKNTRLITYDLNGGSGSLPAELRTVGSSFSVASAANISAPFGTYFVEWNTEPDGSGESYNEGDEIDMPSDAFTLYAIWDSMVYTTTISSETWKKGTSEIIVITIHGDTFAKFAGVNFNGSLIHEMHYDADEGSTIITLRTTHLETLESTSHSIDVLFADGTGSVTLTVLDADPFNIVLVLFVVALIFACIVFIAMAVMRKR
jgi:hypothetical protein